MVHDFSNLRNEYTKYGLSRNDLPICPKSLFLLWLEQAKSENVQEPNAMCLSTADVNGFPSSRIVLLKQVDDGFCFFTNYNSLKGKQISINPKAALLFYWQKMERQVRIQGFIEKMDENESEKYFRQRTVESQKAAIISNQSQAIDNNMDLQINIAKFDTYKIQRPSNWGGYRLLPSYYEFWQGRINRLHERYAYIKSGNNWEINRLAP